MAKKKILVTPSISDTTEGYFGGVKLDIETWKCWCGNVNKDEYNHKVITVATDGPFGGESGYYIMICLKCGRPKLDSQSWYDCTRPPKIKVEVSVTPIVSVTPS